MNEIESMMAAYAQDAVESGKKFNKQLDFSERSIQQVEDICSQLYNDIPKGFLNKMFKRSPSEDELIRMSNMFGGYIGQVLINNLGGSWAAENNTIILKIGELKMFPTIKVYKRLKNGPEDNIYHYYQLISREISKG
jgi:hypothetical protein